MLSVIVPIYNEEKYIVQCISSILQQDYPKNDLEVIFVDGMSCDKTREIVKRYIEKYPYIRLLDNPQRIVPVAMNIGIKNSNGSIIMRLDAHSNYPTNYFSILTKKLIELGADNVGVACRTDVLNKNSKTFAIREVLCNKYGVGNSVFRLGVENVQEVDTVPFGCWPRVAFEKYGFYDERLVRNQDFELNKRIIKGGGHIYIVPDTYCTYYARESFKSLWKQNFLNGVWGIRTVLFTKNTKSLAFRHYIPMLFVLSLVVPTILSFIWKPFLLISLFSFFWYIITIGMVCVGIVLKKRLSFFYLLMSFMTLHISNGLGMLYSLFTARNYVKKVNKHIK